MSSLSQSLGKRIVFTGGSGVAGRHVIQKLLNHGHEILNVDVVPLKHPKVYTLRADLTDGAQAYNSLSCHFRVSEPFKKPLKTPDAVVHFAGIPRPMLVPDSETFRINTMSSYNILEAACKLGIKKVILASSVTTYGVTYAEGDVDFPHFPLTEETPTEPMDVYATSKVCMERIGKSFAIRFPGVDIYSLRLAAVVPPEEHQERLTTYNDHPEDWKPHAWSYVDVRDLGNMVNLCIEKDGLGFQVFNAVSNEITNDREGSTEAFLRKVCPNTIITRKMGEKEAPMSNRKIKEMLGYKEEFSWREVAKRDWS